MCSACSTWPPRIGKVFVEVANEPENNNIDPVAVMKGVNRRGVLSAYGLDPGRHDVATWKTDVPMLDYGTAHDLNRDLENSPSVTRLAMAMQNAFGIPFVNDEPIGAIDPGNKSFKQTGPETWGGVNGGGDERSTATCLFPPPPSPTWFRPATPIIFRPDSKAVFQRRR